LDGECLGPVSVKVDQGDPIVQPLQVQFAPFFPVRIFLLGVAGYYDYLGFGFY